MATFDGVIQMRHGSAASAISNNTTLADGEPGWDGTFMKVGPGNWNTLRPANTPILVPTAVKTATYTAVIGEMVRVNTTSGNVTINLPTTPDNNAQVGVAKIDSSTNDVIITRGGADVFLTTSGATTLALPGTNKADGYTTLILQYSLSDGVWLPVSGFSTPLSGSSSGVSSGRGLFASRPASGTNVGDLYACTDIGNEYRWNGTIWEMYRSEGGKPHRPPPTTGWSPFNSATITTDKDCRVITLAATGNSLKGELRTLSPTSNYRKEFYLDYHWPGINWSQAGIILKNSGAAQVVTFGASFDNTQGNQGLQVRKWDSYTSFNSDYLNKSSSLLPNGTPRWLAIEDDGINRLCQFSYNGVDWMTLHSTSRTNFITSGPDLIGWFLNSHNSGGAHTDIARLRSFE